MFNITRQLCVAACAALVAPAFGAEWMTDFDAAKAKAKAEDKAILMDFTGSDWCGPCMHLKSAVLDTPAFEAYAKDKFVLMEVDMPRNPEFDAELRRRNEALGQKYGVQAFPTIMVLSADGQVAGGFLGGRSTVEEVTPLLDEALANLAELKAAEAMEGDARLKALHALYRKMPRQLAASLADRLVELDTEDVTGIREETRVEREREAFREKFSAAVRAGKSMQEKLAIVNEELRTAHPQNRMLLLRLKLEIQEACIETVEDVEAAKQTLMDMAEADPASKDFILKFIEERMSDPAKALEEIKAMRRK